MAAAGAPQRVFAIAARRLWRTHRLAVPIIDRPGRSVKTHPYPDRSILLVNAESARVKLSLQQSMCSSPDCSFIGGYFLLDKKIAALKYSGPSTSHDWMKSFGVGNLVKGEVGAVEEYGVILNFKDHPDVVGLVEHHQLGVSTVKVGCSVKGLVVDFSDGVVNLFLKPELVDSVSKDGKKEVCWLHFRNVTELRFWIWNLTMK